MALTDTCSARCKTRRPEGTATKSLAKGPVSADIRSHDRVKIRNPADEKPGASLDYFLTATTPASTFPAPTSSLLPLALDCESFGSFGFGTFQKPGVGTMNSIPTWVLPIKVGPTLVTRHNNSSLTLGFSMRMIWFTFTVAASRINAPWSFTMIASVFSARDCFPASRSRTMTGTRKSTRLLRRRFCGLKSVGGTMVTPQISNSLEHAQAFQPRLCPGRYRRHRNRTNPVGSGSYRSFAYSALASRRMGTSGSASFHKAKNWS